MAILRTEIARTPLEHMQGLMGRKHLPKDSGMLFDFGNSRPLSFWMANTYIPLQIAFIEDDGRVGQIERMVPLSTRAIHSKKSYRFALEVNDGWFDENKITIGSVMGLPEDVLQKTAQAAPLLDVNPQTAPPPAALPPQPSTQPPPLNPNQPAPNQPNPNAPDTSNPGAKITVSIRDILKEVKNRNIKVEISYVCKSGNQIERVVVPPLVFEESGDGKMNNLVKVFDISKGQWRSFIIDGGTDNQAGIVAIHDLKGNPITSVQQLDQLEKGTPLTQDDEWLAKGKMTPTKEEQEQMEYQRLLTHKT
jgi:uncharacterized membrane protein (UPF0127 family)